VAVIALIVLINLCIFLLWYRAERATDDNAKLSAMYERFTASWLAIHFGDYLGLLTCCFSHSDATHLFVNMVAFATVAVGMTAFLGGRRIFALYVGAGCLSTLVTLAWEKFYISPGSPNGLPTPSFHLGASGSVFAFLALSAALAPRQTFYLFFVIPVQARILLPAIALFEVLCCLDEEGVGKKWHENVVKPLLGDVKIDSAAHLGGMAAGYAYAILLLRRRGRGRHLFR
jgi:membrane associated rhomboid family serine protease